MESGDEPEQEPISGYGERGTDDGHLDRWTDADSQRRLRRAQHDGGPLRHLRGLARLRAGRRDRPDGGRDHRPDGRPGARLRHARDQPYRSPPAVARLRTGGAPDAPPHPPGPRGRGRAGRGQRLAPHLRLCSHAADLRRCRPYPRTMSRQDRPWVMRTYAGHSTATASNALYRTNLAKGQTGLSVAFDLPTQTGYDPDDSLSRGEVGKVGVPIPHLGEMRRLFDGIPLTEMNTSMTINATAMWLLALYQVVAEEQNPDRDPSEVAHLLAGTTQNDIVKEYLSRGTYVFPPEHSLRLITDVIAYAVHEIPSWNPINICSYHLQEAGATPTQELAYALCTAIAVLDAVKASGQVSEDDFEKVVGRISFFVNAGVRFVEEMCKMRAFVRLWDELTRERYGVEDEKMRRFRYGVQVNSLGLTEAQPENNVQRIVLEMLGVTLSKDARARAVQLPAWNEALGLPRPWDQQWSLRLQQVL